MSKTITLNVRLLRSGWKPEEVFTEKFAPGAKQELKEYPWDAAEGGRLFIGQIYDKPPNWLLDFFPEINLDPEKRIFTGGAGAVTFVPLEKENRIVAVCFGHVHLALNAKAFERRFGLMVTLNSVLRDQLRTIELATPDAVTFQKHIQASKNSDIQAFGVDKLRDLVRVAGGKPKNSEFASFVAGKDSLSITCKINPYKFHKKCEEIFAKYEETTYREEFGWIDNLQAIDKESIIKQLDEKLKIAIKDLLDGNESELHIAPPTMVNYTEGLTLQYHGFGSKNKKLQRLSIKDYIEELDQCNFTVDIDEIKNKHRIEVNEGDLPKKWRVYDCFVFDTTIETVESAEDAGHYILFAGEWYQVEKSFKKLIEKAFDDVKKVSIIGKTKCRNEKELIEELSNNKKELVVLDRVKINLTGVSHGNFEPCDFFSNKGDFIHLKDGKSSAPISHLWSQGVVSAESFVSDEKFRERLREEVKKVKASFVKYLPKSSEKVVRENYRVVYGIMRKPFKNVKRDLDLPFFSKVSLQAAVERLNQLGIPVAIEFIEKPDPDKRDEGDVEETT